MGKRKKNLNIGQVVLIHNWYHRKLYTQQQLAKLFNISQSTISRICMLELDFEQVVRDVERGFWHVHIGTRGMRYKV